jgi:pentatricopeptide repeat protein
MRHLLLICLVACSHSQPAKPAAPTPAPVVEEEGFDEKVRADFFDGLRGDTAAMDRAMKACEDALAKNPKDPEAMVWHGAGVVGRASHAFQKGDRATGIELYTKGLAEMDAAVAIAPEHIGVRIPRGAVVLAMAPFVPEPERTKLLERGIADYEKTYAIQRSEFAKLTLHSREQLLYGLVDGYANLGKVDKASEMFATMKREAAGSELLPRAEKRSRGEAVDGPAPCEQCHR